VLVVVVKKKSISVPVPAGCLCTSTEQGKILMALLGGPGGKRQPHEK